MVVTFFEQYFCVYSIQKRDLIKQKLETTASHHPWSSISKLIKLSWLEKNIWKHLFMGKYWVISSLEIFPKNELNKKLKTYQLIYFYNFNSIELIIYSNILN